MPGTIDIAGKPVKKSTAAVAVLGVIVLGIGVYRYKKSSAANAAAAAATAAQTATGTGAGSSDQIDPATGFPYGSPEDAAALSAQSNYATAAGGYGYSPTGSLYTGGTPYSGIQGGFTSNPQWSQAAESYLVGTAGADPNTVGNALGKYITGQPVTADQQQVIEQAIAFEGYPPVPGPNGYPPSILTAPPVSTTPPPGGGGGGTPPPTGIAVPNVVGDNWGMAYNDIHGAGLTPKVTGASSLKGINTKRTVTSQNPKGGTNVAAGATVTVTLTAK